MKISCSIDNNTMILPSIFQLIYSKINRVYISIFLAYIVFWVGGTSLAWTSPTLPKLLNATTSPIGRSITISEASWISSLVTLGGVLGPFISGYSAHTLGKKRTMLIISIFQLAASVVMALATVVEYLYIARFIMGLSLGGVLATGVTYVTELSNKNNRGFVGSLPCLTLSMGMLFTYCFGPYMEIKTFNLIVASVACFFLIAFWIIATECPIYHLDKGNEEKAKEVIAKKQITLSKSQIDFELQQIKSDVNIEEDGTIGQVFRSPSLRKLFYISSSLFMIQDFCGGIFIEYYSETIFDRTSPIFAPEVCAMIVGAFSFLSCGTTPFIADRFGRKKILVMSCFGMSLTQISLAVYVYLTENGTDTSSYSFVPLLTLSLAIYSYNVGVGPLPWLILAELFPQSVKIAATSLVSSLNWLLSFAMAYSFAYFVFEIGLSITFFSFGCSCFLFGVYCFFVVPETKGRSLEELHVDLAKTEK